MKGSRVAREPQFPAGNDQASGRLSALLGEVMRSVISSGAFLQRYLVAGVVQPRPGEIGAISAGLLNRVRLTAPGVVVLPRISPALVGVPIVVVLPLGSPACAFRPSGLAADGRSVPLINGGAAYVSAAAGFHSFITDGRDWYVSTAIAAGGALLVHTGATLTLSRAAHASARVLFTNPAGCVVTVSAGSFLAGDWVDLIQGAIGQVSFAGSAVLSPPASFNPITAEIGALVSMLSTSGAAARLFGHLELI